MIKGSSTVNVDVLIVVVVPFTVKSPDSVNPVADNMPVPALYVKPASLFGGKSPVADSNNATLQLVSVVSATVIFAGVMFAVPSKDVPPIVLAVARAVAVADNATAILDVPSKDVPPIVLAVARAVEVAASVAFPAVKFAAVPEIFVPTNADGVPKFPSTIPASVNVWLIHADPFYLNTSPDAIPEIVVAFKSAIVASVAT